MSKCDDKYIRTTIDLGSAIHIWDKPPVGFPYALSGNGHWLVIGYTLPIDVIKYETVTTLRCTCGRETPIVEHTGPTPKIDDKTPDAYVCGGCQLRISSKDDAKKLLKQIGEPFYLFKVPYRSIHCTNKDIAEGNYVHTKD